jgi:hypothetical protein
MMADPTPSLACNATDRGTKQSKMESFETRRSFVGNKVRYQPRFGEHILNQAHSSRCDHSLLGIGTHWEHESSTGVVKPQILHVDRLFKLFAIRLMR